jgi:uncharacterized protein
MPGLAPCVREMIAVVLRRHPQVVRARLFGSRALGTQRPESDIDIALDGEVDDFLAARIAGELDELALPYDFDVQAYATVRHGALREHIDRIGLPIFARDEA